jgi:hypothetical protein
VIVADVGPSDGRRAHQVAGKMQPQDLPVAVAEQVEACSQPERTT